MSYPNPSAPWLPDLSNLMQKACGHPLQPVVFPLHTICWVHGKTASQPFLSFTSYLRKQGPFRWVPHSQAAARQEFTEVTQIPCCYAIPPTLPKKCYPSASLSVSESCPLDPCWGLKASSLSTPHSKLQAGRNTSLSMVWALCPEAAGLGHEAAS